MAPAAAAPSTRSVCSYPTTDLTQKERDIEALLSQDEEIDLWKLRELALTDGGLVSDSIRKKAWPKLVGLYDIYYGGGIGDGGESGSGNDDTDDDIEEDGDFDEDDTNDGDSNHNQDLDLSAALLSPAAAAGPSRSSPRNPPPRPRPPPASVEYERYEGGGGGVGGGGEEEGGDDDEEEDGSDDDARLDDSDDDDEDIDAPRSSPAGSRKRRRRRAAPTGKGENGTNAAPANASAAAPAVLAVCRDFDQIERDVARCTWHLLTGSQRAQRLQMEHLSKSRSNRVARLVRRKQRKLANLINYALCRSYGPGEDDDAERLRYYQGYHDVACIFLSSLGGSTIGASASPAQNKKNSGNSKTTANMEVAASVLLRISRSHLRDCLRPNFAQLQTALRLSLFPLLARLDPEVHNHLQNADMEPYFCLSWVITWFSHEIRDTNLVKRLFDAFLVSHPLLPLYLSAAMLVHPLNRREILDCECDFALLHQTLAGLPKNSSLTGWKYQPNGGGYVTDDEEAEGTVSTGTGASIDDMNDPSEFLMVERLNHHNHNHSTTADNAQNSNNNFPSKSQQETGSLVSSTLSCSLEPPAPVGFQVLIDSAVDIMRRVPPRHLLGLSRRYYGNEQVDAWLRESSPGIEFFRDDPPEWAVAASAKSDWYLKRQAKRRRRRDTTTNNNKSRPRWRRQQGEKGFGGEAGSNGVSEERSAAAVSREAVEAYLKENTRSLAVIASGFGPGDDDERRRMKKRRKVAVAGAVAVALVAVAVGVAMQYGSNERQQQQPSPPEIKTVAMIKASDGTASPSIQPDRGAEEKVRMILASSPRDSVGEAVCEIAPAALRVDEIFMPSPILRDSPTVLKNAPLSTSSKSLITTQSKLPPSRALAQYFKASKLLAFTTWSADAAYYAAFFSAGQTVALREARRANEYLLHTYAQLSELYAQGKNSDFLLQAMLMVNYSRMILNDVQRTLIEHTAASLVVAKVKLERLAAFAKGNIREVTENARGWILTEKVVEGWNSPAAQRVRRKVQQVKNSPVTHKVIEATAGALLDANPVAAHH